MLVIVWLQVRKSQGHLHQAGAMGSSQPGCCDALLSVPCQQPSMPYGLENSTMVTQIVSGIKATVLLTVGGKPGYGRPE